MFRTSDTRCRLCLQPCYFNKRLDNRNFREKAQDILVLYLNIDEEHISIVCDSCQSQVESFYQFKRQCRQNEKNRQIRNVTIAFSGTAAEESKFISPKVSKPRRTLRPKPTQDPKKPAKNGRNYIKKTDRVNCPQVRLTKEQLATKTRKELYRERRKQHNKERYRKICELCGKSLNKSYVEGHMNKHRGIRPYACGVTECGETFGSQLALRSHIKHRHFDGHFPCPQCGKMYTNASALRLHIRTRHREKTIFCEICNFGCHVQSELKTHMLVHTQQRDFKCEFCGKAFYARPVLELHRRSHTGERPYACHVCDFSHAHRILYVKHMQKFHPGEEIRKLAEIQRWAKAERRLEQGLGTEGM